MPRRRAGHARARYAGDFVGEPEALGGGGRGVERQRAPRARGGCGRRSRPSVGRRRRARRAHRSDGVGEPAVGPVQLSRGPSRVRGLPHAGRDAVSPSSSRRTTSSSCSARPCSPTTCVPRATSIADGTALFLLTDDPDAAAFAPVGAAVVTTLRRGIADLLGARHQCRTASLRAAGPRRHPAALAIRCRVRSCSTPIARLMPADAVLVEEAPSHRNAMHDHFPIRRSDGFYCGASGGLGLGVAGRGGHRPRATLSGGSSACSATARASTRSRRCGLRLSTSCRSRSSILNNRGYSALKAFGLAMGIETLPGVNLPGIEFVNLAIGFGVDGRAHRQRNRLAPGAARVVRAAAPSLLDVWVDPTVERCTDRAAD